MSKIKVNDDIAIFSLDSNAARASSSKVLIVSTHGGWDDSDGYIKSLDYPWSINFYAHEHYSVTGDIEDAVMGKIQPLNPGIKIKNYELTRFEHDPKGSVIERQLRAARDKKLERDVLKVRSTWTLGGLRDERAINLRKVLDTLKKKGYNYSQVLCLFCRYTGEDLAMDGRKANQTEIDRMQKVSLQRQLAKAVVQRR